MPKVRTKMFGNRAYRLHSQRTSKREAEQIIRYLREGGSLARLVKESKRYSVFWISKYDK